MYNEDAISVNIALIPPPFYDVLSHKVKLTASVIFNIELDCNLVFNPPPPSLEHEINDTDLILIIAPRLPLILTAPPRSLQVQDVNDDKSLIRNLLFPSLMIILIPPPS
jgi:hypothetical protein